MKKNKYLESLFKLVDNIKQTSQKQNKENFHKEFCDYMENTSEEHQNLTVDNVTLKSFHEIN